MTIDELHAATVDGFRRVDDRFEGIDQRFNAVDERFNAVDERFNAVDERFNAVDERLKGVDERMDRMDQRFDRIERELVEIRAEIKSEGETTRRHFNVMVERVEAAVRIVADGMSHHAVVLDNHENRLQAIEKRV